MSAVVDFFCLRRKYLMLNLLLRNMKVKYRGSILGYFWTLLVPFFQVIIFYYLYQVVLKVPVPNYLVYMVSGMLPWYFFSATVNESFEALVAGQELLTQVPVPLQAFPASSVMVNIFNFVVSLPILFCILIFKGPGITPLALWLIPLLFLFFLFTYSLSFLLASTFVVLRDLKYVLSLILQVWLYATPILYPVEMVPAQFKWVLQLNPLSGFFLNLRNVLVYQIDLDLNWLSHLASWTIVTTTIAVFVCKRYAFKLVEKL
jgi:lipopolysaccharide transport system permease protein